MNKTIDELLMSDAKKSENEEYRVVIRVTTCYWKSVNGFHSRKDCVIRKRLSGKAHSWLDDEIDGCGVDIFMEHLIGLDTCKDGLYEIVSCNVSRDWETGYIDGCDWKLIPWIEKKI